MAYTPTIWTDGVTPVNAVNMNKLEQGLAAAIGIPADVVVPAANHLIRNRYNAADAQPAFRLLGDGSMYWGDGGASAPDTHLWRGHAHQLQTENLQLNGTLDLNAAAAADTVIGAWVGTDPQYRLQVDGNGKLQWSDGTNPPDVNLYRGAAGQLRTDNGFWVNAGQLSMLGSYLYSAAILGLDRGPTNLAVEIYATPDTDSKMTIRGNGKIEWGTGVAAKDTNLYRVGANLLGTDSGFYVGGQFQTNGIIGMGASSFLYSGAAALGNGVVLARAVGDADNRFTLSNNGNQYWGDGTNPPDQQLSRFDANGMIFNKALRVSGGVVVDNGNVGAKLYFGSALDTEMYRQAAGAIKTTGAFLAGGNIQTGQTLEILSGSGLATGAVGIYFTGLPNDGSGWLLVARRNSDSNWRFMVGPGGALNWGDGAASPDTQLVRDAANSLTTFGRFLVGGRIYGASDIIVDNGNTGSKLYLGSALDTNLYRAAAGVLKTDGALAVAGGIGTALPASPVDGQIFTLTDSLTAPTYAWDFRYVAGIADAYKWVFIGGSPAAANVAGPGTRNNTAYGDLSDGASPSITAPRAGIYDINFGAQVEGPGQGSPAVAYTSVQVGAGAPSDNDLAATGETGGTNVVLQTTVTRTVRKTAAASDVIKIAYRSDVAGALQYERRWISIIPVRVA